MKKARYNRVVVVEARDDTSLGEDTKASFIWAVFHLSNSTKVEIACFGDRKNVFIHV
jgi:hypothetical protein